METTELGVGVKSNGGLTPPLCSCSCYKLVVSCLSLRLLSLRPLTKLSVSGVGCTYDLVWGTGIYDHNNRLMIRGGAGGCQKSGEQVVSGFQKFLNHHPLDN
jgi:hypothetical protein